MWLVVIVLAKLAMILFFNIKTVQMTRKIIESKNMLKQSFLPRLNVKNSQKSEFLHCS